MNGFLTVEKIHVPQTYLETTYAYLQAMGEQEQEGVALWAGVQKDAFFEVRTTIIPKQSAESIEEGLLHAVDTEELDEINRWLTESNLTLLAQIHSHPGKAYHSDVDAAYPIVATLGGFSIVVPDFANRPLNIQEWAVYRLLPQKGWCQLPKSAIKSTITITNKAK